MGRLLGSVRPSRNMHWKTITMDVIERQSPGASFETPPDSTVRQAGAADVRAMPQPAVDSAPRYGRDVLADFLQYDLQHNLQHDAKR